MKYTYNVIGRIITVILILVTFFSCVYQPDGSFDKVLNEFEVPSKENITINAEGDTILMYSSRFFKYSIKDSTHEIKTMYYQIDNQAPVALNKDTGRIRINNSTYNTLGKLTIGYTATTESGSFSDLRENETFSYKRTWVINKLAYDYDKTFSSTNDNGYLKFTWDQFPAPDFKQYRLRRVRFFNSTYSAYYEYVTTDTFCTDSIYIGETGNYELFVETTDGYIAKYAECSVIEDELPKVTNVSYVNNEYKLSFENSKYKQLDSIRVKWYPDIVSSKYTDNLQVTIASLSFREYVNLDINYVPKNKLYYNTQYSPYLIGGPFWRNQYLVVN